MAHCGTTKYFYSISVGILLHTTKPNYKDFLEGALEVMLIEKVESENIVIHNVDMFVQLHDALLLKMINKTN